MIRMFSKRIITFTGCFLFIIGSIWPEQTDEYSDEYSYELAEHLLTLTKPVAPYVFDGKVIFSLPSSYRRAGVAFAHEDFAVIYWFRKLDLPIENTEPFIEKSKVPRPFYHDSGVMFTVYTPPEDAALLEYRFIADGLWIADPLNPGSRLDPATGVKNSLIFLDPKPKQRFVDRAVPGLVHFSYQAEAGETVFLAGNFNNWDPFMYRLTEETPGRYGLSLHLPAGAYHYVFFYRGRRLTDPSNAERIFLADGSAASVVVVR